MRKEITPTDALFGFMGWLTSREEPVTLSSRHDAAIAADLVVEFCKDRDLDENCSEHYPDNINCPPATIKKEEAMRKKKLFKNIVFYIAQQGEVGHWIGCEDRRHLRKLTNFTNDDVLKITLRVPFGSVVIEESQ